MNIDSSIDRLFSFCVISDPNWNCKFILDSQNQRLKELNNSPDCIKQCTRMSLKMFEATKLFPKVWDCSTWRQNMLFGDKKTHTQQGVHLWCFSVKAYTSNPFTINRAIPNLYTVPHSPNSPANSMCRVKMKYHNNLTIRSIIIFEIHCDSPLWYA